MESDKKYPFEVMLCGAIRPYFELRKRLFKGGSTRRQGIRAMAGMYDRAECYWYGALAATECRVVCDHLGLTEEEGADLVKAYRREVMARP
jgi:hypothetical protein